MLNISETIQDRHMVTADVQTTNRRWYVA